MVGCENVNLYVNSSFIWNIMRKQDKNVHGSSRHTVISVTHLQRLVRLKESLRNSSPVYFVDPALNVITLPGLL